MAIPAWARTHLAKELPDAVVHAAKEVGGRRVLASTSLGAVLVQKTITGKTQIIIAQGPTPDLELDCPACGEALEFYALSLPTTVYCSRCGHQAHVDADGQAAKPTETPVVYDNAPDAEVATVMAFTGDTHPVVDVEGIGPATATRLEAIGITNTDQLYRAPADVVAKHLDVPEEQVTVWQSMCELIMVKGVGPQYGEALVRSGIPTIEALKRKSANVVAKTVNAFVESQSHHPIKVRLTPNRVVAWQKAARTMRRTKRDVHPVAA